VRRPEDEEEGIPIGRIITPLNIPGEHHRCSVILVSFNSRPKRSERGRYDYACDRGEQGLP
jgi:hypothetical protein